MKSNLAGVVGAVTLTTIVGVALTVNSITNGAPSDAIMLLLGFAATQIPALLKLTNVEEKVNGNYSGLFARLETLESHLTEAMKKIPPEIAEQLPKLPEGKEEK